MCSVIRERRARKKEKGEENEGEIDSKGKVGKERDRVMMG